MIVFFLKKTISNQSVFLWVSTLISRHLTMVLLSTSFPPMLFNSYGMQVKLLRIYMVGRGYYTINMTPAGE